MVRATAFPQSTAVGLLTEVSVARRISFVKAHACGNDFLVMEAADAGRQQAAIAQQLCARHTGVGADGIEFLERRPDGSLFLRLFNSDGSEAELSGNGTRCVAVTLAEREGREQMVFGTHGGERSCRVVRREGEQVWVESGMGVPRVMERRLQPAGGGPEIHGVMVNVGNPHLVLFPEREDFGMLGQSWQELGRALSTDPSFRFGTNVEFVRVRGEGEIEFRIFERGCGPTESSGTGTCASAAAAMATRGTRRELTAIAPGGAQYVSWPEASAEMQLTGPAQIVCAGEVFLP